MSFSLLVWKWSTSPTPGRAHEIAQTIGEQPPPDSLAAFDGQEFVDVVLRDFGQTSYEDGPVFAYVYDDLEIPATWIEFSIAWSSADRAAKRIPALAASKGLVAFDPQASRIASPCIAKSLSLELENRPPIYDPTPEEVAEALTQLNSNDPSFAILESPQRGYVQAAGNPQQMTVEWRTSLSSDFKHLVGAQGGFGGLRTVRIPSSAGYVSVKKNQVLTLRDVQRVFVAFAKGDDVSGLLQWDDVTHRFS